MKTPPKPGRTNHQKAGTISHSRPASDWFHPSPMPAKRGQKLNLKTLPFKKGTPPGFTPM